MQIILVSRHLKAARTFTIMPWHVVATLLVFLALVFSTSALFSWLSVHLRLPLIEDLLGLEADPSGQEQIQRIFRALRHEYRLVARLSQQIVTPEEYATYHDLQGVDPRADYNMDDMDILPVADPTAVTKMQQMGKASLLREMAEEALRELRLARSEGRSR